MTPEQRDAATEHEQDQREFTRRMEKLSAALEGCDMNTRTLGQAHALDAAREAVLQWEAMW